MEQLKKNTVESTNQLKDSRFVTFENSEDPHPLKIMFVGNSITLHGHRLEIGWCGRWGMAASSKENDYAHICMRESKKLDANASFCICQVCEWESNYKNGEDKFYLYEDARNFNADIIVMRAVENCSAEGFEKDVFIKEYDKLLRYLNLNGKAKIIVTSSFWHHPADEAIKEYAASNNLPFCHLGDLGEDDKMKAIGKFEHSGVANHPGDEGMIAIAYRIMKLIKEAYHEL